MDMITRSNVTAGDIAQLPEAEVAGFLRTQSQAKTLSTTMRQLNVEARSGDLARRRTALAAIRKLGFL